MAKKKTKKKAKKKKAKKKVKKAGATEVATLPPSPPVYRRPPPRLEPIFAIEATHIPNDMYDECLDIDDEFPLHYATGIVRIEDSGKPFPEWLKTLGFQFSYNHGSAKFPEPNFGWLAVWGT
jgi:hypothetical protein